MFKKPTVDLSRLSDAERQALRLLAEGHTAKSIANTIRSTPTAVNERLREARRKTGVGSSRELARLLKAQEYRHEKIGMGKVRWFGAALAQTGAEPWRPQTGVFAMIGFLTLTIAGAGAIMQIQPELASNPRTITDPDLGTFGKEGAAWLYPIVRRQARDHDWAPVAERTLNDRYATVRFFGNQPKAPRVMCGTTVCEVAVSIPAIESGTSYGQAEAAIAEDMRPEGLIHAGAVILGDATTHRGVYLAYYLRAKR